MHISGVYMLYCVFMTVHFSLSDVWPFGQKNCSQLRGKKHIWYSVSSQHMSNGGKFLKAPWHHSTINLTGWNRWTSTEMVKEKVFEMELLLLVVWFVFHVVIIIPLVLLVVLLLSLLFLVFSFSSSSSSASSASSSASSSSSSAFFFLLMLLLPVAVVKLHLSAACSANPGFYFKLEVPMTSTFNITKTGRGPTMLQFYPGGRYYQCLSIFLWPFRESSAFFHPMAHMARGTPPKRRCGEDS